MLENYRVNKKCKFLTLNDYFSLRGSWLFFKVDWAKGICNISGNDDFSVLKGKILKYRQTD